MTDGSWRSSTASGRPATAARGGDASPRAARSRPGGGNTCRRGDRSDHAGSGAEVRDWRGLAPHRRGCHSLARLLPARDRPGRARCARAGGPTAARVTPGRRRARVDIGRDGRVRRRLRAAPSPRRSGAHARRQPTRRALAAWSVVGCHRATALEAAQRQRRDPNRRHHDGTPCGRPFDSPRSVSAHAGSQPRRTGDRRRSSEAVPFLSPACAIDSERVWSYSKARNPVAMRDSCNGETRTRTADTTIFSRMSSAGECARFTAEWGRVLGRRIREDSPISLRLQPC
jgi:hypothetical protein